jgi:purine-nucleoside/S-methyl-5'-thioadenosine phosphorylase / adenosine deaminase
MPSETLPGGAWRPDWQASPRVGALMSTRQGGVSVAPWDSLNLGVAVGDDVAAVAENRRRFAQALGARPVWLRQVHGSSVLHLQHGHFDVAPMEADAAWTDEPGLACTVQVADCLPVLMAAPEGRAVAAAHAGWRGLAGGVVEAALDSLCEGAHCAPQDVAVWLGPCIGPRQFEVGAEVLEAFGAAPADPDTQLFVTSAPREGMPRWRANLPRLTSLRLRRAGVRHIDGGSWCTVEDSLRFFSYRRDGLTGRLAAAVFVRG